MIRRNASQIRHLAFQILAQLPETETEALRVLDYARKLLIEIPREAPGEAIPLKVVWDKG